MQRLFSTFAAGWPGAGLLLLRAVIGIVLIDRGVMKLCSGPSIQLGILSALAIGTGLLLIAGLGTPVAGTLVAAMEVWKAFLLPGNLLLNLLIGTIAIALAMIGPGAWSIDARRFGRKHIYGSES